MSMTKKKLQLKLSVYTWVIVALLVVVMGALFDKAIANNFFDWGNVEKQVAEGLLDDARDGAPGEELGALPGPDIASQYLCVNGDCTYHLSGDLFDASTTLFAVTDPFLVATTTAGGVVLVDNGRSGFAGNTSTVELVRVMVDGAATTTWEMDCTSSNSKYSTSTTGLARAIVDTESNIPTSSLGIIESGVTSSTNPNWGSFVNDSGLAGATLMPRNKILLTPNTPYLVCKVFQPYGDGLDAFTSGANTFRGTYSVRVSRHR